jgi:hypothetical protein
VAAKATNRDIAANSRIFMKTHSFVFGTLRC